jgi:hypothetical protein
MEEQQTISKYDRLRAMVRDINGAISTKPSTIQHVQSLTGRAETFVVTTARAEEQGGDFVFIECIDENQHVVRLALPPKVANAIASQRDALSKRRRSAAGKRQAAERKARGEVPGFMRKKKQ